MNVEVKKGTFVEISIFIRPHIKECLKRLKEHYEIVLFTASYKGYADAILNHIDPDNQLFDYRLYRDHCIQFYNNAFLVKDLRIIRNRDLKDIVLVDNSAISFLPQLENGVPILPFYDHEDDDGEFLDLTRYLMSIKDKDDLRICNKQTF